MTYTLSQETWRQAVRQLLRLWQGLPLLLALRDLVDLEPVVRNVKRAGVIVWMVRPVLLGIHDSVWPQEGELVCSSGGVPFCIAVLNGLASSTCRVNTVSSISASISATIAASM